MPLVCGLAASYSPALYRERDRWPTVQSRLVGATVQPADAARETPGLLDEYEQRLGAAFARAGAYLAAARIETLVVVSCDRGTVFDASNTPQLHVFAGPQIWGDPARPDLGEEPARAELECDESLAVLLADELVAAGFDLAESRGALHPLGDPARGLGSGFIEPLRRLCGPVVPPIVPIHINCHVEPCISAHRMVPFGRALAQALTRSAKRVGLLASGGLSGDLGGYLAGWVDDVLDRWVLGRLQTGRSDHTARLFDMDSLTLRGTTREIRLWTLAGTALETVGMRANVLDYLPFHHGAVGTALAVWE